MELTVQDLQQKLSDLQKSGLPDGPLFSQPVSSIAWLAILDYLGKMLASLPLRFLKLTYIPVTYASVDNAGNPAQLRGLLIIPQTPVMGDNRVALMGYQHGTQPQTKFLPSYFNPSGDLLAYLEVLVASIMALSGGYLVAMPDYQCNYFNDQGQKTGGYMHPYVIAKPLSFAVGDLLLYAKGVIPASLTWNNQLFLVGYSEGGYTTMAAAKRIQNHVKYKDVFKVTAAAPMAGPHDLTGAMIPLMLRQQPYPAGVFLPMTIRGYHGVYGDPFDKETTLKADYQNIWQLVNGFYSADDVHEAMPAIPREVLTQALINELSNTSGPVYQALAANNLCNWQPQMPLHLYHAPNDDLVPFQNSQAASLGCHVPLIPIWPLPIPDIGPINTVHAKAFLPCMFAASAWFHTLWH